MREHGTVFKTAWAPLPATFQSAAGRIRTYIVRDESFTGSGGRHAATAYKRTLAYLRSGVECGTLLYQPKEDLNATYSTASESRKIMNKLDVWCHGVKFQLRFLDEDYLRIFVGAVRSGMAGLHTVTDERLGEIKIRPSSVDAYKVTY